MITISIERNAGHPWSGRPGFDRLYFEAATTGELAAACARAQQKFSRIWISGTLGETPAAVLYKPRDARASWHDSPEDPHPGHR